MNEDIVFEQALDLADTDERVAFVNKACGESEATAQRILRLVDSYREKGEFMDSPAMASDLNSGLIDVDCVSEKLGDRIGSFELIEKIGEGGMAVVFRGRQETPFIREVAVKIIKPGLETRQLAARMQLERQALAMMNHSGIASVYEAGITDNGRPFFAMELIDGAPITTFCDQNDLDLNSRIGLLISVCDAVEHAHRRGFIHRDLKPANVFVNTDRQIKVIDFGIAKVISGDGCDEDSLTQMGQVIGTPQYMSPEQASFRNEEIDTRTDVYGLGTVLYELLTGRPPFADKSRTELLSNIISKEPVRLSRLEPGIDRDLETVVLKALEKSSERRYSSTRELAEDLKRYLNGRPVLARRSGAIERLIKWAKRSKTAAALVMVSVVGTMILAGVWASFTWQLKKQRDTNKRTADRLQVEKDIAVSNYNRAHQSIRKYLDALVTHTPLGSSKQLEYQKQIFEIGSEFYEELIPSKTEMARSSPELLASIEQVRLEQIQLVYEYTKVLRVAGEFGPALEYCEFVLAVAEELAQSASEKTAETANQYIAFTHAQQARIKLLQQNYEGAIDSASKAIETTRMRASFSVDFRNWYLAEYLIMDGVARTNLEESELAANSFKAAIRLTEALPDIPDFELTRAHCRLEHARLLRLTQKRELAIEFLQEGIEILEPIGMSRVTKTPRYAFAHAECLFELGNCYHETSQPEKSLAALGEAIQIQRSLINTFDDVESYQIQLIQFLDAQSRWSDDSQIRDASQAEITKIESNLRSARETPDQLLTVIRLRMNQLVKAQEQFRWDYAMLQVLECWSLIQQIPADHKPKVTVPLRTSILEQLILSSFTRMTFAEAVEVIGQQTFEHPTAAVKFAVCHAACGDVDFAKKSVEHFETDLPCKTNYIGLLPLIDMYAATRDGDGVDTELFNKAVDQLKVYFLQRGKMHPYQRLRFGNALCYAIDLVKTRPIPDGFDDQAFIDWAREGIVVCIVEEESRNFRDWDDFHADNRFNSWLKMVDFKKVFLPSND